MSLSPSTTGATITATADALYTPTSGYNARIEALTLTNTSGSTVTVDLWRGTAVTGNVVLQTKSLETGKTYTVKELVGHWLADGSPLTARASTAGVVALVLSTLEFAIPS